MNHAKNCPAYGNYQPPYAECTCGADDADVSTKTPLGPRAEWPAVMMAIAEAAGSRSRDATTRVGAVVCTAGWRVIGTGYNGPPAGSPPDLPMAGPDRHKWVTHAEENALLQAVAALGSNDLGGCRLFSTRRPCADCVRRASHLGIRAIAYAHDELSPEQSAASMEAARALGVAVFVFSARKIW